MHDFGVGGSRVNVVGRKLAFLKNLTVGGRPIAPDSFWCCMKESDGALEDFENP